MMAKWHEDQIHTFNFLGSQTLEITHYDYNDIHKRWGIIWKTPTSSIQILMFEFGLH